MTPFTPFVASFLYPYPESLIKFFESFNNTHYNQNNNGTSNSLDIVNHSGIANNNSNGLHYQHPFIKNIDPNEFLNNASPFQVTHIVKLTPRSNHLYTMAFIASNCQHYERADKVIFPFQVNKMDELKYAQHLYKNINTLNTPVGQLISNTFVSIVFKEEIQVWNPLHMDMIGKVNWQPPEREPLKRRKRADATPNVNSNNTISTDTDSNHSSELAESMEHIGNLTPWDQLVFPNHDRNVLHDLGMQRVALGRKMFLLYPVLQENSIDIQILHIQDKKILYHLRNLFTVNTNCTYLFRVQHVEMDNIFVMNTQFELCVLDLKSKQLLKKMKSKRNFMFIDSFVSIDEDEDLLKIDILTVQGFSETMSNYCSKRDAEYAFLNANCRFVCILMTVDKDKVNTQQHEVELVGQIDGICIRIKKITGEWFFLMTSTNIYRCRYDHRSNQVHIYESISISLECDQKNNFDFVREGSELVLAHGSDDGYMHLLYYEDIFNRKNSKPIYLSQIEIPEVNCNSFTCKLDSDHLGNRILIVVTNVGTVIRFKN